MASILGLTSAGSAGQAHGSHAQRPLEPTRKPINDLLAGSRGISMANAVRLAKFFAVGIEEFITREA